MIRQFVSYPKSGRTWLRFMLSCLGLEKQIHFHHDRFEFNDGNAPPHDFRAGALQKDDYIETIKGAGFEDVEIVNEISFGPEIFEGSNDPLIQETSKQAAEDPEAVKRQISASLRSIQIRATKA